MTISTAAQHVSTIAVPVHDLPELILVIHTIALQTRAFHDNIIDLAPATLTDLRPALAQQRYRLNRRPVAAFAITRRALTIDVALVLEDHTAHALLFTRGGQPARDWARHLTHRTSRLLAQRHVAAELA